MNKVQKKLPTGDWTYSQNSRCVSTSILHQFKALTHSGSPKDQLWITLHHTHKSLIDIPLILNGYPMDKPLISCMEVFMVLKGKK